MSTNAELIPDASTERAPIPDDELERAYQAATVALRNDGFMVHVRRPNTGEAAEHYVKALRGNGVQLLDCEGEEVVRLPWSVLIALSQLPPLRLCTVLVEFGLAVERSKEQSYRHGEKRGHRALVETVHELLGVPEICAALAERQR